MSLQRGIVYLVRQMNKAGTGPSGFFKVGASKQDPIENRLRDLQTGNPYKLEFLRKVDVDNMKHSEDAVDKALTDYKVNYGGGNEWYIGDESKIIDIFEKSANK